jgi:hypothetical protein
MKKLPYALRILIANVVLLLFVFVIGEGTCRIFGIPYKVKYIPHENAFGRFDPELGWSYIPNKSAISTAGDLENPIKKPVYFDENGIRVPYPGFKFDYSKPTILFIGCSITMGHGLSYEETFVSKFASFGEVPYQIVNLGVQGYGTDQALLTLKRYISKFNTKVVIYTFFNDHILRNGNYDRRMLVPTAKFLGTKPLFALKENGQLYLKKKPLLYKYYEYTHSWLLDLYKIRVGSKLGTFPPKPEKLTVALIKEIEKVAKANGARFILLNWRWEMNKYNDDFFHDINADIIDTLKGAPDNWNKMVILGGVHPTAEASAHAAELLLRYFKEKNLLSIN